MINSLDLEAQIRTKGAVETARHLKQCLIEGKLKYTDFASLTNLYEHFVTDRNNDKVSVGSKVINRQILSEEAASYVSVDGFGTVAAQLFFNALTTKYNAAEYNVKSLFKNIPSNLARGEKFGGLSNIESVLAPLAAGDALPTLTPTEDYSESPAQQRKGAIMNITLDMLRGDRTGEIMGYFEKMGSVLGLNDELEACSTLADVDYAATNAAQYARTHYNWKKNAYDTYSTTGGQAGSPGWVNEVASEPLIDWTNLNDAWIMLATILDPFTGYPMEDDSPYELIVPTGLAFIASRIKRSVQFRSGTESSNNDILITAGSGSEAHGLPVNFGVTVSKYLHQILANNGVITTTTPALIQSTSPWFFGQPGAAFSWQTMLDITPAQAVKDAGEMFTRSLAASFKVERWKSAYVFNPRFMAKMNG